MSVKERIIEESVELFRNKGIKSTTMDDIAKHIGISKRTIYENFKDKETLLIDSLFFLFQENRKFMEKVFNESDNVIEAIINILKKGTEFAQNRQFIIIEDIKKYYPQVYKEMLVCHDSDKQKTMQKLILAGIKQEVFRDDLNPEIIAYVFTRQSEGLLIKDKSLDSFSRVELFNNMVIAFIRGLCTTKGIEILDNLIS